MLPSCTKKNNACQCLSTHPGPNSNQGPLPGSVRVAEAGCVEASSRGNIGGDELPEELSPWKSAGGESA